MIPTRLYIHAVFYDAFEDHIFEVLIPVNEINIEFFNNADNNLNDLKEFEFSGRIKNTAEGSILLGAL